MFSKRSGCQLLLSMFGACASLAACEKPYPKENVKPYSFESQGPGAQVDAAAYVPTDAGTADAGSTLACSAPSESTSAFTKAALLESIAGCTEYQYCELEGAAQDFVEKTAAHAATPDSG